MTNQDRSKSEYIAHAPAARLITTSLTGFNFDCGQLGIMKNIWAV